MSIRSADAHPAPTIQTGSCCFVDSISERGSNGLPMKPCDAARLGVAGRALVHLPGEHDHRDRADAGVLLDPPQRLPAVDLRHHHVEQDQVRRLLAERGECLLGATGLADEVALGLEVDAHVLPQALVVVDDQDERAARRACSPRCVGPERSRNWSRSERR